MTSILAWPNQENGNPSVWVVADSRITQKISNKSFQRLTDAAVKIFSVPITIKKPDKAGFYNNIYHSQKIGFCYAGSSLVALNVYATIAALLSGIIGFHDKDIPSLCDYTEMIAKVLKKSIISVGENFNGSTAVEKSFVEALVVGYCFKENKLKVYKLSPKVESCNFGIEIIEAKLDSESIIMFI